MIRALWIGGFLLVFTIVAGSISLALTKFYGQQELLLLFPLAGVLSMFFGEKILAGMERKLGRHPGGAGAALLRSVVASVIVISAPTLCWGAMQVISDLMVIGLESSGVPNTFLSGMA